MSALPLKRRIALWLARRVASLRIGRAAALPSQRQLRRVTVLKLDRIGDFILATAFLRPLAETTISVTLIVRKPNGDVARQQFPNWDIIELPGRETASRNIFCHRGVRALVSALEKADLLVDLRAYRDYSDAVIASWVPATCKLAIVNAFPVALTSVTFPREDQIYDILLPSSPPLLGEVRDLTNHRTLRNALLGESSMPAMPSIFVPPEDALTTKNLLEAQCGIAPDEAYVVVCPGASSAVREYPAAHLAAALKAGLIGGDFRVVIAGSAGDKPAVARLISSLSGAVPYVDATNKLTLRQHIALLAGARAVICMETSHVHIVGALGVPCVCVMGGGHFGEFGPWGESHRFRWVYERMACYNCEWQCIHSRPLCVEEISPERIASAIREVLHA